MIRHRRLKLAILTAFHGRHKLARLWLRHFSMLRHRLAGEVDLHIFATVSPTDFHDAAQFRNDLAAAGIAWQVHANNPVSYKWQAGVYAVRTGWPEVEAVTFFGSDDFPSIGYLRLVAAKLAEGKSAAFGPDRIHFLDAVSGRMLVWQGPHFTNIGNMPPGAGRTFSRAALDALDWRLWTEAKDRGLDISAFKTMHAAGVGLDTVAIRSHPESIILDVKIPGTNIHSYAAFHAFPEISPVAAVAACHRIGVEHSEFLAVAAAELATAKEKQ